MRYLLDTHSFIWWMTSPNQLSQAVLAIIVDPDTEIYLSVVSIWEMEIKIGTGKLTGFSNLKFFLDSDLKFEQFEILNLSRDQVHVLPRLPRHHQDPFDRALISQAIHEDLILISKDLKFSGYPVKLLW